MVEWHDNKLLAALLCGRIKRTHKGSYLQKRIVTNP